MEENLEVSVEPNHGWDSRIKCIKCGDLVRSYLIKTKRFVLVYDTLLGPKSGGFLREQALMFADGTPLVVVNSHADWDHYFGNMMFPEMILGSQLRVKRVTGQVGQKELEEKRREHPRDKWGEQENNGFDFVRILFPNVSAFIAPEITQIAQLFPGPTPDKNRTVLNYLRREPIKDDADREAVEGAMNFFRNVTYEEDYLIGMEIQKGLASGAHEDLVFGKNERGNQYFHEWVNWYLAADPDVPKPEL